MTVAAFEPVFKHPPIPVDPEQLRTVRHEEYKAGERDYFELSLDAALMAEHSVFSKFFNTLADIYWKRLRLHNCATKEKQ